MPSTVANIPISGGENTSTDPATPATTLVSNMTMGPASENVQRAGLIDTGTSIGTSPVIGMWPWRDWVIIVTADRKVWAMPVGAPYTVVAISDATAATQLAGTARPVFSEDGYPRVVISGGGAPLQWTGGGLCSVLITAGYTTLASSHVAYLGERMLFNDISNPTQWYWSDLGDGAHSSVDPASFTTADASPDNITGIYSTIRQAFVFGERSLQVYTVGQDPLNPFDNLTTLAVGCAAPYSPLDVDGSFMWLDDKRRIVVSDGSNFQDVSTDVWVTLRDFKTVSDCWSYREDIGNTTSYVFRFPTEGRELVLDASRKFWHERYFYDGSLLPYQAHAFWKATNQHLFGSTTTGAVYAWDEETQTDLGNPLILERVTGWLNHGTNNRKRSNRVRVVLRRGTGGIDGTGALEVRVADDGGPWGDWEQMEIGDAGDSDQNADAFPGGVFRRRRYHFRYSGTLPTALLLAEEHFQECAT